VVDDQSKLKIFKPVPVPVKDSA